GTDTDLVLRARAGSADAIDALYERCGERLLGYIRLKMGRDLRTRMESRDILQSTLIKSVEHFAEFQGSRSASLMAWLAAIAEREIRDRVDHGHRQRRDAAREVPLATDALLPSPVRSALTQAVVN